VRVVGRTGSVIACLLAAVWGGGCAEMDYYRPTPKLSDPVTINVMYFSPVFGPDSRGKKVVYLLKQVRREHSLGDTYRTYFCRVSLDGKRRKEIVRLSTAGFPENLANPGMPMIPTLDVSSRSRKAAIGIDNVALGGIWVLNLDGTDFHSVQPPEWQTEWKSYRASQPPRLSQPLWSADGEWIVFQEIHYDRRWWVSRSVECHPDSTGYAVVSTNDVVLQAPDGSVSRTLLTNASRQARYKDLENEKFRW